MTADWHGKRYWLVGASEGLGRALAERMSKAGASLILTARDTDRLDALVASLPGQARALPCDIADGCAVQAAAAELGDIDGVVFLAGVYWPMTAQSWNTAQAESMADINFTGAIRVLGAALPQMLARGQGHIVLTGSLSGFRGLPGAVGYAASKAAIMVLAESLYADLRASGLRVQLANPGFIRTRLTNKNDFSMPFLMEPDVAADRLFAHMNTTRFKTNFPRAFSWLFRLAQFLPDAAYYRIFASK